MAVSDEPSGGDDAPLVEVDGAVGLHVELCEELTRVEELPREVRQRWRRGERTEHVRDIDLGGPALACEREAEPACRDRQVESDRDPVRRLPLCDDDASPALAGTHRYGNRVSIVPVIVDIRHRPPSGILIRESRHGEREFVGRESVAPEVLAVVASGRGEGEQNRGRGVELRIEELPGPVPSGAEDFHRRHRLIRRRSVLLPERDDHRSGSEERGQGRDRREPRGQARGGHEPP